MPKSQKGFSFVLIIIAAATLIFLGIGTFMYMKSTANTNSNQTLQETAGSNCNVGINGNNGDNFCSNYHETSSKCQPGFSNLYPDGCTKPN